MIESENFNFHKWPGLELTHREEGYVEIKLPSLPRPLFWHLCVNTYGDGRGRYFYPEGEEIRITKEFIMRPRSVAVFIGK